MRVDDETKRSPNSQKYEDDGHQKELPIRRGDSVVISSMSSLSRSAVVSAPLLYLQLTINSDFCSLKMLISASK